MNGNEPVMSGWSTRPPSPVRSRRNRAARIADAASIPAPTSASWINQVERRCAELTRKQLQRGVHRSTADLEADIKYLASVWEDIQILKEAARPNW